MTKVETIQNMANAIFTDKTKMISSDEYLELIKNAKSSEEKDFYSILYSYFLGERQKEVIKNVKY